MVAVLLAVLDVLPKYFALDAHLLAHGDVDKLDGHQWLQVLGLQLLAIVGVVLQGEALRHAVVLDLSDLVGILVALEWREKAVLRT